MGGAPLIDTVMLRDEDIRIDIGRAEGGSFMRVVHVPTGVSRTRLPPIGTGKQQHETRARLLSEIEDELRTKGLTQYIR